MVKMPNIVGYTQELAAHTLTDLGSKYELYRSTTTRWRDGKVARTDKSRGRNQQGHTGHCHDIYQSGGVLSPPSLGRKVNPPPVIRIQSTWWKVD